LLGGDLPQQVFGGDDVDELVGAGLRIPRERVGPEVGRYQLNRLEAGQGADGAQLLELVLRRQAVAALALDRGDAEGQHALEARQVLVNKLLFGGGADGLGGDADSAAGLHDGEVGFAGQTSGELSAAVTGPGDVGVRVDEAGDDETAAGRPGAGGRVGGCVGGRAEPGDAAGVNEQGRVVDGGDLPHARPGERAGRDAQQRADVGDQEGGPIGRAAWHGSSPAKPADGQETVAPGGTGCAVVSSTTCERSGLEAASNMPWLSTPRIMRGARLVTMTICRPTRASGS
jgi:hypothetical protein